MKKHIIWASEINKEDFCWKLYTGKCTDRDIRRYTKTIRPEIQHIYGF